MSALNRTAVVGLLMLAPSAHASLLDLDEADYAYQWIHTIWTSSAFTEGVKVLNVVALLVAGIVIAYTTLRAVLASAAEGEVMGRGTSAWAVPIRVVLSIAMLLPLPQLNNLSAFQGFVMWSVEKGAGAAAGVWSAMLSYMSNNGMLYPPPSLNLGETIAISMLHNSGCVETINRAYGPRGPWVWHAADVESDDQGWRLWQNYGGYGEPMYLTLGLGPVLGDFDPAFSETACGRVELNLANETSSIAIGPKTDYVVAVEHALATLDEQTYQLARELVNHYPDSFQPQGDEIQVMAAQYDASVNDALRAAVAKLNENRRDSSEWLDKAQRLGWVGAGLWARDIMRMHEETRQFAQIKPQISGPSVEEVIDPLGRDWVDSMGRIESYLKGRLIKNDYGTVVRAGTENREDGAAAMFDFGRLAQDAMRETMAIDDPVGALGHLGHKIIGAVEIGLAASGTAYVASKATGDSIAGLFGAGGLSALGEILFTGSIGVAVVLGGAAMFLAYWLPNAAFFLWTVGLLLWIVKFLKTMVATTVWAIAHAIPAPGSGIINSEARQGWLLLAGLILRPPLMVLGLIAAFYVQMIGGKLALAGIVPVALSASQGHTFGLVSVVFYIVLLTILVVKATTLGFSLIHEMPDEIIAYIGGHRDTLGDAQQESAGRQIFAAGISKTERAMDKGGNLPKVGAQSREKKILNGQLTPASG